MLPNRFPDGGEAPEYNTVDATLWYFHAIDAYVDATRRRASAARAVPGAARHRRLARRGTRYGIHVDPDDGLLRAGEPGVQLTWMDAKVGDWVVTPRIGKPVEINALWHNALARMATLARALERRARPRATIAHDAAARRDVSFATRFWYRRRRLPVRRHRRTPTSSATAATRACGPNQIFAVSLPHGAARRRPRRAVVDTCARSC